MNKKDKYIYWTPRILSIVFILFLTLFSLDVFEMNLGFWGTIAGFLIHSIPSMVLSLILAISWKYEIVGGVTFICAGFLYIFSLLSNPFEWYMIIWSIQIAGPAFVIGILFFIGWNKKKKERKEINQ